MSASSGIIPSDVLLARFASAVAHPLSTRFLKISIANDTLVLDHSISQRASFADDLLALQDPQILNDNIPAYILARTDDTPSQWITIFYVPDSATVRDKMLYASTRNSLMKALGPVTFADSIFATSKDDLTPEAYTAHKRHMAAPKPLSSREQELADIRAAENDSLSYQGTRARASHVNDSMGFPWSEEAETAMVNFSRADGCAIMILQINPATETVILKSSNDLIIENLPDALPLSEPCYAFLAWPHSHTAYPRREIIYIYSCPATSPVKNRMIYSSGFLSTFRAGEAIIRTSSATAHISSRRIEISDPKELDKAKLLETIKLDEDVLHTENAKGKPFSRPRKPARRN